MCAAYSFTGFTCVEYIYVFAHTSTQHVSGGTDDLHRLELQLGSGSTYTATLYDIDPDIDQNTKGKGDFWKLSISNTNNGFGIPYYPCLLWPDIQSISVLEGGNDGWLIDTIVTVLKGAYGGHRMLSIDVEADRWIDGNQGEPEKRWKLNNGNFCQI